MMCMLLASVHAVVIPSVSMAGNTGSEPTNNMRGTAYWNSDSDMYLTGIEIWKDGAATRAQICGIKLYFNDQFNIKAQ
jgi:hypothetical protein